jgi:hypothetical protein
MSSKKLLDSLVRAGADQAVAMKISGHKARAVSDRYNITSEEDLRHPLRHMLPISNTARTRPNAPMASGR